MAPVIILGNHEPIFVINRIKYEFVNISHLNIPLLFI